ncbi:MAG: ATP-dependent Clp protease ATP-binding subunit, partial [Thermoguttaceae bacterium]|nr:ATP-dependent Clp protease ATP-binding subunit [Thermoguttaceae bacterium]
TTAKETVEILKGLRERYENHHRVTITDDALEAAVELSERYISARCLPDKAIDVIDEAGARVRLKTMTRPPDLHDLDRRSEELQKQKDRAVADQDFEQAALLRDQIDQIRKEKDELQKEWRDKLQQTNGVVDATVVSEVVSLITGVPLTRLTTEDSKRLIQMEDELHRRVVSQHEAIQAISKAVRRSRSGVQDPKRPIGSFIFAGPTGVGKTLLAKALAEFMFGDEDALVSIDMSEYMEKYNVSRLVGAPPGYVGHDEGGQLTEKIRRRPYSVVLLDEIEKAHPDVFNILLQVLEEGRLTDSFGRVVDFRNTILIMTTNAGAEAIKNESAFGFQRPDADASYSDMKRRVTDEIERVFRPEFINRFNDIIVFRHLSEENLGHVVDMELKKLRGRLQDKNLRLLLSDEAKDLLVKRGSNLDYGARPLRRAIESNLEDPLSEELLRGAFDDRDVVVVEVKEDETQEADALEPEKRKRLVFFGKKLADLTPEELESDAIKNYCVKKVEPSTDAEAETPASTDETSDDKKDDEAK